MVNHNSTRRSFLKVLGCVSILILTLLWLFGCHGNTGSQVSNRNLPTIRFGLCADVHKDVIHDADNFAMTLIWHNTFKEINPQKTDTVF